MASPGGEVTGTIFAIEATQQITEKFRKRVFVLTFMDGRYPQFIELQVTGARCEDLDRWAEGEIVTVAYNLRGRQGNLGRVVNALEVWKIEPASATTTAPRRQDREPPPTQRPASAPLPRDYRDDMPPPDDDLLY